MFKTGDLGDKAAHKKIEDTWKNHDLLPYSVTMYDGKSDDFSLMMKVRIIPQPEYTYTKPASFVELYYDDRSYQPYPSNVANINPILDKWNEIELEYNNNQDIEMGNNN